jgi:FAD/FMN-containing dehydrogenase
LLSGFCKTAADFMVPPTEAAAWEKRYHHDIDKAGLRGFVFGHILEGRLHVNLLAEHEQDLPRCHELLESWAQSVTDAGGLLAAENGVGKLKKNLVLRFLAPQRREQIGSILSQLDPAGLFGGFEP